MRFPSKKKTFEKISPERRPKMSVSFPLNGWEAACAIRYADASHDNTVNELKELAMGADSVATIVESGGPSVKVKLLKRCGAYQEQREKYQTIQSA